MQQLNMNETDSKFTECQKETIYYGKSTNVVFQMGVCTTHYESDHGLQQKPKNLGIPRP